MLLFAFLGFVYSLVNIDLANGVQISWQNQRATIITVQFTIATSGWVAFGWKKGDGLMTGATAIVGWINQDGSSDLSRRELSGYVPPSGADRSVNGNVSESVRGTTIWVDLDIQSNGIVTEDMYLLWAYGERDGDSESGMISKHSDKDSRKVKVLYPWCS
jgi:hypothetical protein